MIMILKWKVEKRLIALMLKIRKMKNKKEENSLVALLSKKKRKSWIKKKMK